jgi:hypothetical protein
MAPHEYLKPRRGNRTVESRQHGQRRLEGRVTLERDCASMLDLGADSRDGCEHGKINDDVD